MNKFDQFVKHKVKAKFYIRYADDFVFLDVDKNYLENMISKISEFLTGRLKFSLHPDKVFIKTLASGVDFLGWINFLHYRVLRNSTKRRMLERITKNSQNQVLQSYLGLISHGNSYKLSQEVLNLYGL